MFEKIIHIEQLIHSIKTAIACTIGFFLTFFVASMFNIPINPWIVISIIVVMCAQIYVGSMVQKAYFRFLGTFVGCLFAMFALVLFGHSHLILATTIGLSSFLFSYLAVTQENLTYAGTLGAATTAIILLNPNPTLLLATQRFLEISAGILIAALISQFVLPIHARTHLRRIQANTLEQLSNYFIACALIHEAENPIQQHEELDETIIKSLSKQRQLAKEAKREPLGDIFDPTHFIQSLQCEKEMLRAISFMHHALTSMGQSKNIIAPALHLFGKTILSSLKILTTVIREGKASEFSIPLSPIKILKKEIEKNYTSFSQEEKICVDSLLFAAETLMSHLTCLASLHHIPLES